MGWGSAIAGVASAAGAGHARGKIERQKLERDELKQALVLAAQDRKEKRDEGLNKAQIDHLAAESEHLRNPIPKKKTYTVHQAEDGSFFAINSDDPNDVVPVTRQGKPIKGKKTRDPADIHRENRQFDVEHPLPTQGGAAGKVTEGERKASALLGIAEGDAKTVDEMETSLPNKLVTKIPIAGNMIVGKTNPDYQKQLQAGKRLVDQWLRFTSGAAISQSEREQAYDTYIPQPGDTPQALQSKAEARKRMIKGLRGAAGRAAQKEEGDQPSPATKPVKRRTPEEILAAHGIR